MEHSESQILCLFDYNDIVIWPISIFDLFPMVKQRIGYNTTLFHLTNAISTILRKDLYGKIFNKPRVTNKELTNRMIEESELALQLHNLSLNLGKINGKKSKYTIYDLIELVNVTTPLLLINKIIEHSNIDPLHIAILLNDEVLIQKYFRDFRNNNINIINTCINKNPNVCFKIKTELIYKIFLLYELLVPDVVRYIFLLERL